MPLTSIFTPAGMLELTSDASHGERIYNSLVGSLNQAFDMTPGTNMEAWAYATSMLLARCQYALDRAGNQSSPLTAYDLIPLLEQAYLVVPGGNDTIPMRQLTLSVVELISRGARQENIVSVLKGLVGGALLSVSPTTALSVSGTPISPTVFPSVSAGGGLFIDPRISGQWLQIIDPVAFTGGASNVAYQSLDTTTIVTSTWAAAKAFIVGATVIPTTGSWTGYWYQCTTAGTSSATQPVWPTVVGSTITDGSCIWTCMATTSPTLQAGQQVVVQGENSSQMEVVTVLYTSNAAPIASTASKGSLVFTANFTKAHDAGATVTTGPFPYWWSTQRQILVILSGTNATVGATRNKIDGAMKKLTREVDLWATVAAATTTVSGGTVGPLTTTSSMGTAPFGALTFANTT